VSEERADVAEQEGYKGFQELRVWQEAMLVVEAVYGATARFPKLEIYRLTDQMCRSAISIPSNIAEGQGRRTTKEFVHYASIARGSAAELQTQAILAQRPSYIDEKTYEDLLARLESVSRMLWRLQEALERKGDAKNRSTPPE